MTFTVDDAEQFFAEKIGVSQHMTPEGFLLVVGAQLARTGEQLYGDGETPLKVGPQGYVRVMRDAEEVFRPETVASFEGKDIVDEHPAEGVNPSNWRDLSVGHVQNVRRQGIFLLGDLLIKDADAIAAVANGKRELSCGYDAEYEQTGEGRGRQYNIIGNHVALVKRGRCGPSCAIGDKETVMTAAKKMTVRDMLKAIFSVKDNAELEAVMEKPADEINSTTAGTGTPGSNGGGGPVTINMNLPGVAKADPGAVVGADEEEPAWFKKHSDTFGGLAKRMDGLEASIGPYLKKWAEQEAAEQAHAGDEKDPDAGKVGDEKDPDDKKEKDEATEKEEAKKTGDAIMAELGTDKAPVSVKDSSDLADAFQDTIAMAEIVAPGVKLPTFDAKAKPKVTLDAMCALRRKALDAGLMLEGSRPIILDALHGRVLDAKMPCDAVRNVFRTVALVRKRVNNSSAAADLKKAAVIGVPRTPSELNRLYAAKYGSK
jgi:hypothetical protein